MDLVEDIAIVEEVQKGRVKVGMPRTESCKSCAVRGFCHPSEEANSHWISTRLELQPGDRVKIFVAPALRITSSLILFLMPVLLMLAFYLGAKYGLGTTENISILISVLSLGLSGLLIWLVDKKMGKSIKFEIVEKLQEKV